MVISKNRHLNKKAFMKFSSNQLITALFVTSMIVGSSINAQAHDRSEKHEKKHYKKHKYDDKYDYRYEDRHDDDDDEVVYVIKKPKTIIIEDNDRIYIKEYLSKNYSKHCPYGLAKKHNGCKPQGHSKRYILGEILDEDIAFEELPYDLLIKLKPAPKDYRYVQVDDKVLLIAEASKKIIDAVDILSTLNR